MKGRVWVFDRGIVSEDNLQDLRQRGASYLVGTPRHKLANFERELLKGDWQEIAGKPGVRAQLLLDGAETFVLARSLQGVGCRRQDSLLSKGGYNDRMAGDVVYRSLWSFRCFAACQG
jgi:hypothetical protein